MKRCTAARSYDSSDLRILSICLVSVLLDCDFVTDNGVSEMPSRRVSNSWRSESVLCVCHGCVGQGVGLKSSCHTREPPFDRSGLKRATSQKIRSPSSSTRSQKSHT